MPITNGLITIDEARLSVFNSAATTAVDAELERYVEAATPVIENITGPILPRNVTVTVDGGRDAILLPWPVTAIVTVTADGQPVDLGDIKADLTAGIIHGSFPAGTLNITIVASVGGSDVPPNVKLAARELVRTWWQQGRQGNRPAFGNPADAPDSAPTDGWAIPRRVHQLLQPQRQTTGFG